MLMPTTRGWLKFHGYMVAVSALITLILGLTMWFETLKTRSELGVSWAGLPASSQSLLQQEVRHADHDPSSARWLIHTVHS